MVTDNTEVLPVPPEHQAAAEEVRAHLVAVRGGGLFLSPADARALVRWLDQDVPVTAILRAVERAADARRKNRSRLPLTLGQASRYLPKEARPAPPRGVTSGHPFAHVGAGLRSRGAGEIADALLATDPRDPEAAVRAALRAVRAFLNAQWTGLDPHARARRLADAHERLADLDLDEDDRARLAEEIARDGLRREWPMLEAAHLWDLATAEPE